MHIQMIQKLRVRTAVARLARAWPGGAVWPVTCPLPRPAGMGINNQTTGRGTRRGRGRGGGARPGGGGKKETKTSARASVEPGRNGKKTR